MTPKNILFSMLLTISLSPMAFASTEAIKGRILASMKQGHSLKDFYKALNQEYGSSAVKPLLEIADDEKNADETRWAALFALARLTGKESFGVLKRFMTNPSWMLRDAALKAAAALDAKELGSHIEQRLKDDALIVRTTAVETIGQLKLKQSTPKLVDALFDQNNFHAGKALWIHKHILQVLSELHCQTAVPKLVELLESVQDEKLQGQILVVLQNLTGKNFSSKTLQEQIYLWKRNTVSELTF